MVKKVAVKVTSNRKPLKLKRETIRDLQVTGPKDVKGGMIMGSGKCKNTTNC